MFVTQEWIIHLVLLTINKMTDEQYAAWTEIMDLHVCQRLLYWHKQATMPFWCVVNCIYKPSRDF